MNASNPLPTQDSTMMRLALEQAWQAEAIGEVPVGAVVVRAGQVLGVGHNLCIGQADPTAHAEIVALRMAAQAAGNYRLEGCTLYVTLEPCAMCAGALLNARLERVVFGAADAKAGACGSVVDLFSNPALNHHTQVEGGVLAEACGASLSQFFTNLRAKHRRETWPLRTDALRTPDTCFSALADFPWQAHYVNDLAGLDGLRLHYLDEGFDEASDKSAGQGADADGLCFLCLHDFAGWSYQYRKMIPVWTAAGHRVVVPDLIGFGKSDKPKREKAHSFAFHRAYLLDLVQRLQLENVVLVVPEDCGHIGRTLAMDAPQRYCGVLEIQADRLDTAAYDAPFPDKGYRAGLRALEGGQLYPVDPAGRRVSKAASDFWSQHWRGKSLTLGASEEPEAIARAALAHFRP